MNVKVNFLNHSITVVFLFILCIRKDETQNSREYGWKMTTFQAKSSETLELAVETLNLANFEIVNFDDTSSD